MIVIAPDKFKGTYTADEICRLVKSRLLNAGINSPVYCCPLSDGGEGVASMLMPERKQLSTGVYEHNGQRLVVSSEIVGFDAFFGSGLPLMRRSSYELGRAVKPGIPTTIAVGGTATSDCGAGFLQGLGGRFYDRNGREIHDQLCPETLMSVASADLSSLDKYDMSGVIDVRASLIEGPLTALDFAGQKAFPGESLSLLKEVFAHFQQIVGGSSEWDGAGGGIGFALASVCRSVCRSGADIAVKSIGISDGTIDLVITGEGCVDRQTLYGGKLPDAVFRHYSARNIPVLILYGKKTDGFPYPYMAQIDSEWESLVKCILSRES